MDNYFRLDLTKVMRNIDTAEVLTVYFPYIGKTLVLDLRYNVDEGPMVKLMPMVSSSEERFRSLKRHRPRFGRPAAIASVPWPKFIRSLQSLGVYDRILERLTAIGYETSVVDFRLAFDELLKLEREEHIAAIKGEGYQTVWQRVST